MLVTPFFWLKETIYLLSIGTDNNAIRNGRGLTGKKKACHFLMDVDKVKAGKEKYKCSANDLLMSLITTSVKEYLEMKKNNPAFEGFEVPKRLRIQVPVSIRTPVKRTTDAVLTNSIA
mmetsp:Transcript_39521/g.60333  ORF Transcript_39521/g.60333 Transcript_39521/m.60333 type:complete len:118 (-) Transcript_39521:429-782(-)|eukprot:CAMPEP_0170511946 /NCGR_PEP_ID=MMETSP0208-20121228/66580_1 /TAXON_ID=197538 /ORGANISM="Strombidium inclinatum, Strain S3" /LENGTH=117 /DNA_ID=CAMNT_0010795527 /DNA_START=642 /DNA_END=995 /DNA_ORIENTATION=-